MQMCTPLQNTMKYCTARKYSTNPQPSPSRCFVLLLLYTIFHPIFFLSAFTGSRSLPLVLAIFYSLFLSLYISRSAPVSPSPSLDLRFYLCVAVSFYQFNFFSWKPSPRGVTCTQLVRPIYASNGRFNL